MSSSTASPDEVKGILDKVAQEARAPSDGDLLPAFKYLMPAAAASLSDQSSSTPNFPPLASDTHWYCPKVESDLHKEVATFLIFLFAFQRHTASKYWIQSLEKVVTGCPRCARGFGAARRKLRRKWLAEFPAPHIARFYEVIDKWQAELVVAELEQSKPTFGSSGLLDIATSYLQLFFNEPSLLMKDALPVNASGTPLNAELAGAIDKLSSALDEAVAISVTGPSAVSALRLTPVTVALLGSPDPKRRKWAREQINVITRAIGFDEWCENGTGSETQSLFLSSFSGGCVEQWEALKVIINERRLNLDAIQRGLLEGQYTADVPARADRSAMSLIARLLGSPSDTFPLVFDCFTALLSLSPTRHIWAFDASPELPHTLFSDIKKNSSFQALVINAHPSSGNDPKGKGKAGTANSLEWVTNYLLSVVDGQEEGSTASSGFSEALAKVINFCFAEMQHNSLNVAARAAAAEAGCEAIASLQRKLKSTEVAGKALSSTIEVHAAFIAASAFQHNTEAEWAVPRAAARNVVSEVFQADGRDIQESTLGLATIAFHERRRLKRKRRFTVPDPVRVERLHKVSIRRELWTMAYNALSPNDASGVALMMLAVAPFSHIEALDRNNAWNPSDLKEVVNADDWIASVRAINSALKVCRERFAQCLESIAASPDPSILKTLWAQEGVPKAAVTLLLSPADGIHEPMITLIQPSFEDVDDRGDCFRALLQKFPHPAMEGLCAFLSTFIQTAGRVPEACSLAKWLVRCFTDVLEVLCQPAGFSPPLLQSDQFLSSFEEGKWMTRRISDLWQLMTDSLALIFKRTAEWAPYYDNDVMVDWMRDALIFGRGITDNIRIFESAILSRTKTVQDEEGTPVKMSRVGRGLVQKLEVVLADLVGWLRLTDLETLHQTYELIKTIMGRISKSSPDLSKDSALVGTLLELDKFCRRAGASYNCRLPDDLLSELSELLDQFDLPMRDDDDIQFIKSSEPSRAVSSTATPAARSTTGTPTPPPPTTTRTAEKTSAKAAEKAAPQKNAFAMMMKKAGGNYIASPAQPKPKEKPKPRQMTLDEFEEDDNLLDNLSAGDLDILERRAQAQAQFKKSAPASAPKPPSNKLHINVVPKLYPPKPAATSKFKSNFMKDIAKEHKAQVREMKAASTAIPRLPAASKLGTGLGAYTGPPKEPPKKVPEPSSDSSSSDSDSDEENKGIGALVSRQKPAPPPRPIVQERRQIKVLGGPSYADVIKERENMRKKAHYTKMRLRPDITPLHRFVLAWDPESRASRPPYPPKVAAQLGPLQKVPTTFIGAEQYEKIMQPLFLQELWAQFIKDSANAPPFTVEVTYRSYEDDFIDIDVVVPGTMPVGVSLNDSDIVTIQYQSNKPIFAKVQMFKRKYKETAIKLRILANMDQKGMQSKSKLQLRKHATLSTAVREYASLKGLPYYDDFLLQDILQAHSAAMPSLSDSEVETAMRNFQVNEPQAKAILGAMRVKGFALIQGPPGTGKTKTISGLVGKFLAERKSFIPVNGQLPQKPKLLVCAPSNAAIDEVCKRLMDGVPSPSGGRITPNIVRIGIESSVNVAVKDVSLDNIVEARIATQSGGKDTGSELARIQAELDEVKQLIKEKQDQIAKVQGNDELRRKLDSEYHALNARRTKLGQQSSKAKDAARDSTRHLDGARRAARDTVLKEADIVCATLAGAGQEVLNQYTFETVIIDEAAQAIETSCLIPLKYGCQRCIMVGDPNQLPPTTFSIEAEQNKYNQSLFVRIAEQKGSHMHLLSIQYRMHPDISELPSKIFYQGRLKDGPGMAEKTAAVWHRRDAFGPYRFYNVEGMEMKAGTSTKNVDEARVAVDLYRNLSQQFESQVNFTMRIGIITMYREQMFEIRRQFVDAFGPDIVEIIDFNTVDGFQGQEKDIIILSCVRSGPNLQSIGFLKDFRRMNVALTRAKSSLFVIGNAATLERSASDWNTIVKDARERKFIRNYTPTCFLPSREEQRRPPPPKRAASPERSNHLIPKVGACPPDSKKRHSSMESDPIPPEKRARVSPPANGYPQSTATSGPSRMTPIPSAAIPSANTRPSAPIPSAGIRPTPPPTRYPSPPSGPPPPGPPPGPPPPDPPTNRPYPNAASGPSSRPPNGSGPGYRPPGAAGLPPRPPGYGPPGGSRPPPLPRPKPEDVLFMKKSKKPVRPQGPPPSNVRASMNNHLAGGRRN